MREIKFRAWDTLNKRMLPVVNIKFRLYYREQLNGPVDEVTVDGDGWNDLIEWELMQFTGLFDKNGKAIFEGDIVKWNSWKDKRDTGWEKGQIVWHQKELGFRIRENYIDYSPAIYEHIEVIGSIYENPELLKPLLI